jgi:hypothetical protein
MMRRITRVFVLLSLLAAVSASTPVRSARAQELAVPQRPTFASDPNTTPAGSLQFDGGVTVDELDQLDTPLALRIGLGEASELFLGWSPYLRVDVADTTVSGAGDLVLGTRYRFLDEGDRRPATAVQIAARFPTADEEKFRGGGATDVFVAATLLKTWSRWSGVLYYQLGALGRPAETGVDVEHALAFLANIPLTSRLGIFGEATGIVPPGDDDLGFLGLLGAAYTPWINLVVDGAFGVTHADETSWYVTAGATVNVGTLFPALRPGD